MVGKPKVPHDRDERPGSSGAANPTPGLTPVDQEREASMADEGGAAGAHVEGERPEEAPPEGRRKRP